MAQAGFPEIEGNFWVGLFVPAGTRLISWPCSIRGWQGGELADMQQRLDALGFVAVSSSLEEASAVLKRDSAKWTKVIQAADQGRVENLSSPVARMGAPATCGTNERLCIVVPGFR